jgi:hypothetical protein
MINEDKNYKEAVEYVSSEVTVNKAVVYALLAVANQMNMTWKTMVNLQQVIDRMERKSR